MQQSGYSVDRRLLIEAVRRQSGHFIAGIGIKEAINDIGIARFTTPNKPLLIYQSLTTGLKPLEA